MSEKLDQSLAAQKEQLSDLLSQREQAENLLESLNETIPQLKGAIKALEYVKTLNLEEPSKDEVKKDSPSRQLPKLEAVK
jgi:Tfp pilus assembly protein PilN